MRTLILDMLEPTVTRVSEDRDKIISLTKDSEEAAKQIEDLQAQVTKTDHKTAAFD